MRVEPLPLAVGAGGVTRTPDLLITNQLLYQLSYASRVAGRTRGEYSSGPAQLRGRVRTMTSMPSATVPAGSGGRPSTRTLSPGMSVSSPVTTS